MENDPSHPPLPSTVAPIDGSAVAFWLMGNVLAITAGAMRVPFSARYPQPAEAFTVHVVLVTQIFLVSLLSPKLLVTPLLAFFTSVSAGAFLQLAGTCAQTPQLSLLIATVYVGLWIGGIHLGAAAVRPARRAGVATLFCIIAVSGPLTDYLTAETDRNFLTAALASSLPIPASLRLIDVTHFDITTWVVILLPWIWGITRALLRMRIQNRVAADR